MRRRAGALRFQVLFAGHAALEKINMNARRTMGSVIFGQWPLLLSSVLIPTWHPSLHLASGHGTPTRSRFQLLYAISCGFKMHQPEVVFAITGRNLGHYATSSLFYGTCLQFSDPLLPLDVEPLSNDAFGSQREPE